MTKERYQNPAAGDTVNLRLFSYNSNEARDFEAVELIEIYHLDPAEVTAENPDGRRLVEEIAGTGVTLEDTGKYVLELELEKTKYVIGKYIDVWTVSPEADEESFTVEQVFDVYPSLWYTAPTPIVFDFKFNFQPNKLRKGSKQHIIIEVTPNVPNAGDLRKYYENLAIVSNLKISMEYSCGDCMPAEQDLRLVLDDVSVDYREKRYGYYQIDTEDLDCGLYDIWFKLELGTNVYVSDRYKFQIYN